jgi:hypothetical protein
MIVTGFGARRRSGQTQASVNLRVDREALA